MKDILINNRFRLNFKIASGGFGAVYSGIDLRSGEEVALKLAHALESKDMALRTLEKEEEVCRRVCRGRGMPQVLWYGQECDYFVLATNLLGPSLEDLFTYCEQNFSLKTILLIARQAINRLQYIHSKGLLHRDLKPENMLMGAGKDGNTLYLIDFGLSKDIAGTDLTLPQGESNCGGSTMFASVNYHTQHQQSWKDDLESLSYTLRYFVGRGLLPWSYSISGDDVASGMDARETKMQMDGAELFEGHPAAFAEYHDYVRNLRFNEKPNYKRLNEKFERLFLSKGYKNDSIFDWTERMFRENVLRASH